MCEYCEQGKIIRIQLEHNVNGDSSTIAKIFGRDMIYSCVKIGISGFIHSFTHKINFCPMCGRKLEESES